MARGNDRLKSHCTQGEAPRLSGDGIFSGVIPTGEKRCSLSRTIAPRKREADSPQRSVTNVKARLRWRVGRGDADIFDLRRRRAFAQRNDQCLDSIAGPRDHRLNRSVGPIADPSRDAEFLCLLTCPCPERDTLHTASYVQMSGSHGLVRSVLGQVSPVHKAKRCHEYHSFAPILVRTAGRCVVVTRLQDFGRKRSWRRSGRQSQPRPVFC